MASSNHNNNNNPGTSNQGGDESPNPEAGPTGTFCDLDTEDMPRRGESKRKRFHPFRAVRNIFRRNKRQGVDEDTAGTSKKSRSTSELSTVHVPGDENQTFEVLAPPYAAGLSVSHDSIFTPEHNASNLDPENGHPMPASSLSVQHVAGLKRFKDELFTRVRARRDSDDDDAGLPHSPCTSPTTADVLAQGLKDKPCHSRSSYSAGSLISMGSSENDEDSGGIMSSNQSSRMSLSDRRTLDFEGEFQDYSQPVPLNHNAALHKISVRPKRTHGLPRHRKMQQIAAAAVATLPATPEVTEDQGLKTPSTHSEEDRQIEAIAKPIVEEEKIYNKAAEELQEVTDAPEPIFDDEPIYDEVNTEEEVNTAPLVGLPTTDVQPGEEIPTSTIPSPSKPALSPKPTTTSPTTPEPLFIPVEKPAAPTDIRETLPSPVPRTPTSGSSPMQHPSSPLPPLTNQEPFIPSLEITPTDNKPIEMQVTETPPLIGPITSEVISPVTSRGATPVSLESKIHSKSKSTAAELKLRHEIKQFSKRQKEMKEEMLLKKPEVGDEIQPEVIDVKECVTAKSIELLSNEKKLEKTKNTPTKEVIEEDMTVVSAERFFTPIDRTNNSATGQSENKLYKPVSRVAETEMHSIPQTIPVVSEEKVAVKNKGHFTVNDVGMSPMTEEKFTSTILVSNTSDDATTQMSVISSSDLNQRIPVERPPRKHHRELNEAKNRLTSGLVTVDNQSFSTCSTLKLESDFKINAGKMSPTPDVGIIAREFLEDVEPKRETSTEESFFKDELPEMQSDINDVLPKDIEVDDLLETKEELAKDKDVTKEVPEEIMVEEDTKPASQPNQEPLKVETEVVDQLEQIDKTPKVVLRKHSEKTTATNRNSSETTSAFSCLDFENIMKQRRSITENDILAQKIDEPVSRNTPEHTKYGSGSSNPPNSSSAKRLSVEIVPYNTRVKESNYLSSTPSKMQSTPPVIDIIEKEPQQKTEDIPPVVEVRRKLSFNKTDTATTASNEDVSKHPVQFRIRRGKSLNEKTDSTTGKDSNSLPEKPKIARPKSQIGPVSKDKPSVVEKTTVPEFMKIQLRSSKEELDKSEKNEKNETTSIGSDVTTPPVSSSPKTGSPTPHWEVKIGQPTKFFRQTSVSLPPSEPKPEVKKKDFEKPIEKASSTSNLSLEKIVDTKSQRSGKDVNAENKENMGSSNVLVKDDLSNKDDNILNGNSETDEMSKFSRSTQVHSNSGISSGSMRMSDDGRRKSQGYIGAGMGTDAEPELFRVFARRSIKQRNPDKNKQAQTNKEAEIVVEDKPGKVNQEPTPTQPRQSLSQQVKPEVKPSEEKLPPPWKQVSKPVSLDKTTKEVKVISKENVVERPKDTSKDVRSNSPQQRPARYRAKSVLVNESPIPPRERKTSAPTELPKIVMDKSDNKKQSDVREINSKNSNKSNSSLPQVTVSIKPQETTTTSTTTPIPRKSSITSATRSIKNQQQDIMDNGSSEGSPLSWKQLALQNREERVRKEMRHCPNTVVIDSNSSVRSRNSKVLDLVNNFQKLQTT